MWIRCSVSKEVQLMYDYYIITMYSCISYRNKPSLTSPNLIFFCEDMPNQSIHSLGIHHHTLVFGATLPVGRKSLWRASDVHVKLKFILLYFYFIFIFYSFIIILTCEQNGLFFCSKLIWMAYSSRGWISFFFCIFCYKMKKEMKAANSIHLLQKVELDR